MEFYVTEPVANPQDPSLSVTVDNDLVSGTTSEGNKLYIKAGVYAFDSSLGKNGGYNIPVYIYN